MAKGKYLFLAFFAKIHISQLLSSMLRKHRKQSPTNVGTFAWNVLKTSSKEDTVAKRLGELK